MEKYRIASVSKCCDNVKIFRLVPLAGPLLDYKPGNFLTLHLLDEKGSSVDKRPYSIASSPTQKYIELAIKMVGGPFTSRLDGVKKGDVVGVEGPLGHFIYGGQEKCIFIAGGIGIAPFMSMLRYIDARKKKGSFILLHSCGRKADIAYYDELKALAKNPSIKVICFLTRETPPDWNGELGRIDETRMRKHVAKPAEHDWYICGPLSMALSLKETLIKMNVPERNIKLEGWG